MTDTPIQAGFKLGTFSAAGSRPFAGLVRGERVIALHTLQRLADARGLVLNGSESVFALLQNWDANFAALSEVLALAEQEQAERARRKAIDDRVRDYLATHPEARYGELLKGSAP